VLGDGGGAGVLDGVADLRDQLLLLGGRLRRTARRDGLVDDIPNVRREFGLGSRARGVAARARASGRGRTCFEVGSSRSFKWMGTLKASAAIFCNRVWAPRVGRGPSPTFVECRRGAGTRGAADELKLARRRAARCATTSRSVGHVRTCAGVRVHQSSVSQRGARGAQDSARSPGAVDRCRRIAQQPPRNHPRAAPSHRQVELPLPHHSQRLRRRSSSRQTPVF
jgi:hypothetical protein